MAQFDPRKAQLALESAFGRYVIPLFGTLRGKLTCIGTGFFVSTNGKHALVTAAHVLDFRNKGVELFFYIGPNRSRPISGKTVRVQHPAAQSCDDDIFDIGFVILDGEQPPYAEIGRHAIPFESLSPWESDRFASPYYFLGYPSTQTELHPVTKTINAGARGFLSYSLPATDYSKIGVSATTHIMLSFSKRNIRGSDGNKTNFPKAEGVSGAPLWRLTRHGGGGAKVVGVMIEVHKGKNALLASDIGLVTDHIQIHTSLNRASYLGV
jgi:hypothetical protein